MAKNSSKLYPLYKDEGIVEAITKKLVASVEKNSGQQQNKGNKGMQAPNMGMLEDLSNSISQNNNDIAAITEILPDVDLAMQIIVSSILSPKDMVSTELTFNLDTSELDEDVTAGIIRIVESHFENVYKLEEELPEILRDVLFRKGAYPLVILPESSIDEVINNEARVSLESIGDQIHSNGEVVNLGLLGNFNTSTEESVSLEDFMSIDGLGIDRLDTKINTYTSIVDNPSILKMPMLRDRIRKDKVRTKLGYLNNRVSLEAAKSQPEKEEVELSLFRKRKYEKAPIVPVRTGLELNKATVGAPLVKKLPMEAVIPVHVSGDPSKHVGYFVLLDNKGNPVNKAVKSNQYGDLNSRLKREDEQNVTELIQMTREAMFGEASKNYSSKERKEQMDDVYISLIESNLRTRLENGIYGEGLELAKAEEVYRIMLSRALQKMHTKVLFIPAELLIYIAFDYDEDGVGKSLMDDSKIIASMRSLLMFADTMGAINNSIPKTNLNIKLDKDDPNPGKTVEALLNEYSRTQITSFPIGELNLADQTDYLQKAGVSVTVEGNPRYPDTQLEVTDSNRNVTRPDSDLREEMRKLHIMKFGLAPEHMEAAAQADFATSVARSSLLLSKRIMMWQRALTPQVSRFVQTYVLNHGTLLNELKEHISANLKPKKKKGADGEDVNSPMDAIVQEVVQSIYISLPNPDTSKLENLFESFTKYNEALEVALEAYFNIEMYEGMYGTELEDAIEPMVASVKAYFQRQWLRQNNMLSELDTLVNMTEDNKPMLDLGDVHKNHTKAFMESVEGVLREFRKKGRKSDRNLEKDEDKDLDKFDQEDSQDTPTEDEADIVEETPTEEPETEPEVEPELDESNTDSDEGTEPTDDSGDDVDLPEL